VHRDPVDLRFDVVFEQKGSCFIVDPVRQLLPKPNFEMCCSSNCSLGVAEDHRSLHSLGAVYGLPNIADRNKSVCIPCKGRVLALVGTVCLYAFLPTCVLLHPLPPHARNIAFPIVLVRSFSVAHA